VVGSLQPPALSRQLRASDRELVRAQHAATKRRGDLAVDSWLLGYGLRTASRRGADEPAAGLDGHVALAAEGAVLRFVAIDFELDEGVRFDGKFDLAAAAVDERACGDHTAAGLLDDVDGFFGRSARGPDVLDDEDMLIGLDRESAAQGHDAVAVPLDEQGRNATMNRVIWRGKGARDLLPDHYATHGRGDDNVNARVGKQGGECLTQLFCKTRVLQHERTLNVGVAVASAGEFKMAMADGASGLKKWKEFFARNHADCDPLPLTDSGA